MAQQQSRSFRQVHNLHEVVYTTQAELSQRTTKYLERTDKVYKPSQTLEFNREGELLPWSLKLIYGLITDNVKIFGMNRKPYLIFFAFIQFLISSG